VSWSLCSHSATINPSRSDSVVSAEVLLFLKRFMPWLERVRSGLKKIGQHVESGPISALYSGRFWPCDMHVMVDMEFLRDCKRCVSLDTQTMEPEVVRYFFGPSRLIRTGSF
jgi:hypothetical protein